MDDKPKWRIVALKDSPVEGEKFLGAIPQTTFEILYKHEFNADTPEEAKRKAMKIVRKEKFSEHFKHMRHWKTAGANMLRRRTVTQWAYYLHLISLNKED